jgi:hypothetical protein
MELTWTDRQAVHGCDISASFFDPQVVDREDDFTRRMLPVFKTARPALLYSEQDRKNFVADPLIAQPDAVLRHGRGLLSLEFKSQSRRSHRPEQWQRDIPCSGVLQTLAAAMAVAMESGKTVAPLLRCHNVIYFLRPHPELVTRLMTGAAEAKAYWGEDRYVSASQLAAYCEPWVRARFGIKDDAQAASSEAGRVRHEEMLRR